MRRLSVSVSAFILLLTGLFAFNYVNNLPDENIISYTVDPKQHHLEFYWKDDSAKIIRSIQNLKSYVERTQSKLLFAMNGGMYMENNAPLGLFVQHKKTLSKLNTSSGNGNFYLKPNGVFYVTVSDQPVVCTTDDYKDTGQVKFATQSGPMLVVGGQIHSAFKEGSQNVNIRNGVGVLPDGKAVFAMSKAGINFYDFASYFKTLGCKNALYLDGFVSRTYLPEKNWIQTDGNFGVMIGVTTPLPK